MLVKRTNSGYLPSIFDTFFNDASLSVRSELSTRPDFNVYETENEYVVESAVPGLQKEDFKIAIEDNVLSIASEKESKSEQNEQKYYYKSFCYNSFKTSYSLPDDVDKDSISANYENGILKIMLPKDKRVKELKQIKIS